MEFGEGAQNHLTEELESLRRQIADLKALMREPLHAKRIQPLLSDAARREVEQIQGEIEQRLGYLPPFFLPAKASPEVFSSLWHQMKSSYLDSPMPGLTKEKLFSRLSRVCPVSYAIRYHSCSLHRLGMRSGEILAWLERPLPAGADDLEPCFSLFATVPRPVASWPEPGSLLEDALMRCAMGLFFDAAGGGRNRDELSALLGPSYFARLVMFLEYVKRYHFWLECFPEPGQEKDQVIGSHLVAMLEEEPRLPPVEPALPERPLHQRAQAQPAARGQQQQRRRSLEQEPRPEHPAVVPVEEVRRREAEERTAEQPVAPVARAGRERDQYRQ